MLDLRVIREETDRVRQAIDSRNSKCDIDRILQLDSERRELTFATDEMKKRRNETSKKIGQLKKAGEDTSAIQAEVRELGESIKANDDRLREIQDELGALLLTVPNIPHDSAPVGLDDSANVHVREWGEKRSFDFQPRAHYDMDLFEFPRAARLAGSGFAMYKGAGAKLERALIAMMLDLHTREHGFTEYGPPCLALRETMTGTGQLPKMEDDMYRIAEDDLFLIPTGEVQLVNLHREEMLRGLDLPIRVTAQTPCFRREAGSYGKEVRGLVRLHQFSKVEMVSFTTPESSYEELERILGFAEEVVRRLGLHYRVLELATGDLAFQATKCYDIEVWAPGIDRYLEISSVSNCEEFQARRAQIRFKRDEKAKPEFVHTLNGSGLALPRTVIAVVENYQTADGTVRIPEALQPYMNCETINI